MASKKTAKTTEEAPAIEEQAPEPELIALLPELQAKMAEQLAHDHDWHGETWKLLSERGQEFRIRDSWAYYFERHERYGYPVPWERIIGNAWICLVRLRHPELLKVGTPTNELIDLLPELIEIMKERLVEDHTRYGDEWKRPDYFGEGLYRAIKLRYQKYIDQFVAASAPLPFDKIIGLAWIAIVCRDHPEIRS